MVQQKRILFLTATWHEVPFILAAKKLGFYVITTNNRPDYPGHKYADEYVCCDFSQYDKIIDLCREKNINALSWGCTDPCALAACYVGEKLGLKGHDTYENAKIIHLKDYFKEFAIKYGLRTPHARIFRSIEEAIAFKKNYKYPVIVKPVDCAGGQGVHVVNTEDTYEQYVHEAFCRSHNKAIVVEQYLIGTLHSLNTFIVNQKVVAYCSANDYSYVDKYMTNSGVAPADNWRYAVDLLIPEIEKVAQLLHLVDGQLHMQYIMQDGEPYIIEMMRRNIGNNWSSMINDSIGINWAEWVIRAEAGMDVHNIPHNCEPRGYYGYHMLLADNNGIFRGIEIDPTFKAYVYQQNLWEPIGHKITDFKANKLGNILFYFPSEEEKKQYMKHINELIKVIVD